jgi:hypothetical protein
MHAPFLREILPARAEARRRGEIMRDARYGLALCINLALCLFGYGHVSAHPLLEESRELRKKHEILYARFMNCMNTYVSSQSEARLPRDKQAEIARDKCGIQELNQNSRAMEANGQRLRALLKQVEEEEKAAATKEASRTTVQQPTNAPGKQPDPSRKRAASAPTREIVLSGDWAALCVEQGSTVVCQRYGGFLANKFPAGCEGNNLLVCRDRKLCSIASEVTIVDNGNMRKLQAGIESCPGLVRYPPTT